VASTAQGVTPEAQVRAVVDDWARALGEKDADRVLSYHAPECVHFGLAPPLQLAGAAANDKTLLEGWFASWEGPIGYETRDLRIVVGDEVALCHGLTRMTGTRTTGERTDLWFRQTLGFRKIAGVWKLTHEHESVPFQMDGTLKAAIDLKP
jgi:uncharacterized protein (TIGR02246 family)